MAALVLGVWLHGGLAAQGLVVKPALSVTETWTSNRDLSSTDRQADYLTQVSPAVSMSAGRGANKFDLNYALNGVFHAEKPSLNTVYHSLASLASLSGLDGRVGLDASAAAGRQIVSAFGTQSTDPALNNNNQAQVVSYSLAPYLRGVLLGQVKYQVGVAYTASRSDSGSLGDSSSLVGQAGLTGRLGVLGWAIDGSRSIYENGDRPKGHNGGVRTTWTYSPDIELQLQGKLGSEVDDMRTGSSERTTTWGAGLTWQPGPRTTGRAEYERRFYGNSHVVSLSHRMARTIWTLSDSRSLQTGGTSGRSVASLYDQLFALNPNRIADPVQRDADIRSLIAASGRDPNEQVVIGGFLSGGPTVQRSQMASVAYQGLRTTLSFMIVRSISSSLASDSSTEGDVANGAQARQSGFSLSVGHRLTADASFLLAAGFQRTAATATLPSNELRTLTATWTARLGMYTDLSVGARRAIFDSEANPYQESAVFGSLRMRF